LEYFLVYCFIIEVQGNKHQLIEDVKCDFIEFGIFTFLIFRSIILICFNDLLMKKHFIFDVSKYLSNLHFIFEVKLMFIILVIFETLFKLN
jgi:hypothetical protein